MQDLLWIIADVGGEKRMGPAPSSVSTHHLDTVLACPTQGLENPAHACMEEIRQGPSTRCFVLDVLEFGCWEVSKQDLTALRRLAANVLRNVTNGEIDRIGALVPKQCNLGLVR